MAGCRIPAYPRNVCRRSVQIAKLEPVSGIDIAFVGARRGQLFGADKLDVASESAPVQRDFFHAS